MKFFFRKLQEASPVRIKGAIGKLSLFFIHAAVPPRLRGGVSRGVRVRAVRRPAYSPVPRYGSYGPAITGQQSFPHGFHSMRSVTDCACANCFLSGSCRIRCPKTRCRPSCAVMCRGYRSLPSCLAVPCPVHGGGKGRPVMVRLDSPAAVPFRIMGMVITAGPGGRTGRRRAVRIGWYPFSP